jgi:superoxide dismutase, Cu-Zn family
VHTREIDYSTPDTEENLMEQTQVKLTLLVAISLIVWMVHSLAVAAGMSAAQSPIKEDPGKADSPEISRAIAVLHPTQGQEVQGTVAFTQMPEGVHVKAEVIHLPSGQHAYHVHLYGDCSGPQGKTAGTHFNFQGFSKAPSDQIDRITGNLGNLKADAEGKATAETVIEQATLHGPYAIIGRSVVVHAKPNDPSSPPMGAAGPRLACGVIGIDETS